MSKISPPDSSRIHEETREKRFTLKGERAWSCGQLLVAFRTNVGRGKRRFPWDANDGAGG